MGFPEHAGGHEFQQIQEINSLLVGGEQRGLSQPSVPISSTMYHLDLGESRPQSFHRGSAQLAKLSFATHPDMRVLPPGQASPIRRASAPQPGLHMSVATSHPMSRPISYPYSCMYSDCPFGSNSSSDIAQHLAVAHQRSNTGPGFDMSSPFNSFADISPSRPPISGSDFSNSSAESMFGFSSTSSVPTSPPVSPADDLRFGFYQDATLVKMENATGGIDLSVGWNNPGFFALDAMGGFDTYVNVPQC